MKDNNFNIVVIGAGVIGLAIAEKLSREFSNILVIEKEKQYGQHTSSRNSEVIHSGFYYPPKSLKAKLCTKGNKMIYDFSKKYNIYYNRCGKLVVCKNKKEVDILKKIKINAEKNGLKNIELITEKEAKTIEPKVKCFAALWFKNSGIMDSHGIMSKLENLAKINDVSFAYNCEVNDIKKETSGYKIFFSNDKTVIKSKIVINAAGLWSHKIAKLIGCKYNIEYYKGDYFKTNQLRNLNCLIYPLPSKLSLGVHAILNLNGEVVFGPNAYKVDNINYNTTDHYKEIFNEQISQFLNFKITDLHPDYSGIRPKVKFDNNFNDFIITEEKKYKNFYNLIGIDSPGLTSSLAIAKLISRMIKN
jgi:L-2-hydroxyglutarate oxidase LhgO